jgi:cytochrome b involved in lipid metabolism
MKKTVGVSLFIFFAIVVAILVAGLVFYHNNNNNNNSNTVTPVNNVTSSTNSSKPSFTTVNTSTKPATVLNMTEVVKHNKRSDCYIVINNKVYDITSYFGSHPGGNSIMAATCGTDATQAYDTKGGNGSPHSSRAANLLANYYLGNLVQ